MDKYISRRFGLLSGAAILTVPPPDPLDPVVRLYREREALSAKADGCADDQTARRHFDRLAALERRIAATRSRSLPGVLCKLRLWRDIEGPTVENPVTIPELLVLSTLADMEAIAGATEEHPRNE